MQAQAIFTLYSTTNALLNPICIVLKNMGANKWLNRVYQGFVERFLPHFIFHNSTNNLCFHKFHNLFYKQKTEKYINQKINMY